MCLVCSETRSAVGLCKPECTVESLSVAHHLSLEATQSVFYIFPLQCTVATSLLVMKLETNDDDNQTDGKWRWWWWWPEVEDDEVEDDEVEDDEVVWRLKRQKTKVKISILNSKNTPK